jgi:hypothetical protein
MTEDVSLCVYRVQVDCAEMPPPPHRIDFLVGRSGNHHAEGRSDGEGPVQIEEPPTRSGMYIALNLVSFEYFS